MLAFNTQQLATEYDVIAPDGSEIRLLGTVEHGSMCHCTLLPNKTSLAVRHQTVEEVWYFLSGSGEVWRQQGDRDEVVEVRPGTSLTIPIGTHFQFRNRSSEPLTFVIVTMPAWPGPEEAVRVPDFWHQQ